MEIQEVNIKYDMPTVEVAMERLYIELAACRGAKNTLIKFVHGYGSSGMGGKIRLAAHKELRRKKLAGEIRAFAPGERWNPFDEDARAILAAVPTAAHDKDFARDNVGITVVLI